jgi:diguanylate cyclase (GGDEF)-like protein
METVLPSVVLVLGLLGALLLAVTVHLAQISGRRASRLASSNQTLQQMKANLEQIAMYDALTGLGNRNLFKQQVEHMLLLSKRRGEEFALLTFDLNGFKQINDTLGHEAGDQALCEVAERLRRAVRESDPKFRLGGDEFAVLLGPGIGAQGAATVAKKIVSVVATPLALRGERCRIGLSTGIAVYPQHGTNVERLLRCADAAMYEAKHSSSAIIRVASDDSPTGVLKALRLRRAGSA